LLRQVEGVEQPQARHPVEIIYVSRHQHTIVVQGCCTDDRVSQRHSTLLPQARRAFQHRSIYVQHLQIPKKPRQALAILRRNAVETEHLNVTDAADRWQIRRYEIAQLPMLGQERVNDDVAVQKHQAASSFTPRKRPVLPNLALPGKRIADVSEWITRRQGLKSLTHAPPSLV
jgi:hypothetical protein